MLCRSQMPRPRCARDTRVVGAVDKRHMQITCKSMAALSGICTSASGERFVATRKLSTPHVLRTSGSSRSLRLRSRARLLEIFSQTQEFPPRRKIDFSFVQARSSVVQPFVFLGAPIALGNALFHVRHRPLHRHLLRSDVRCEFGVVASSDCGIERRVPMFPQESYVKENNTTCCLDL